MIDHLGRRYELFCNRPLSRRSVGDRLSLAQGQVENLKRVTFKRALLKHCLALTI